MKLRDFWDFRSWIAVIALLSVAIYCVVFLFLTFVYGCDFQTKEVSDSVVLGDLRIEKVEYWSGCWKDYWYGVDTVGISPDVSDTIFGTWSKLYITTRTYKDSLICDKRDSVRYEVWDVRGKHSEALIFEWCIDCVPSDTVIVIDRWVVPR